MRLIWVARETENFSTGDWTPQITLIRFNKIAFRRNSRPVEHFRAKGCPALDKRSTTAGTVNWIKCTVTVIPKTTKAVQNASTSHAYPWILRWTPKMTEQYSWSQRFDESASTMIC